MGNPESAKALPIAENLDDNHREVATRLGAETWQRMEELVKESRKRHIASRALQDTKSDELTTA